MKNSAKVIFAAIITVVVTGYAISCQSKTETANTDIDSLKVDSAALVKSDIDTTGASNDTTVTAK